VARPLVKPALAAVSILVALGLAAGLAVAAAGDLDPSFDGDGRQTTDFTASGEDRATGVALQGDGKVVAAGRDAAGVLVVARYNPDGSLDSSFDGDGRVTTQLLDPGNQRPGVAIQPDGKIVVAGGHNGDFGLARFTPGGQPDAGFNGGTVITDFSGGTDYAVAVEVQADGKVVAGGSNSTVTGGQVFALARYEENGTLDGNFGSGGRQTIAFPGATFQSAEDLALQGDGKIVMAGRANFGTGEDAFALARLDTAGGLDSSFDADGTVTTPVSGGGGAEAVAIAPSDARIVAAGGIAGNFGILAYKGDGSPDTGFNGDGQQITDFGGGDEARGVAVQPDGKVVAAGELDVQGAIDFAAARYETDGDLDPSFSGDGKQNTGFPNAGAAAEDVALQGDGKTVAAGGTNEQGGLGDFALVRYQADPGPPPPEPAPCCAPPPPGPKTLADLPNPVQGSLLNVDQVAGTVLVGLRGNVAGRAKARASQKGITFVPLTEARQIPVGSFLDTRRGTVRLQSARDRRGTRQQGDFGSGLFQVLQSRRRSARGLTDLVLKGASFSRCRRSGRGKGSARSAQSRLIRRLRSNARGRFRTRGRHSAATVRGTVWLTADRCDGTLTRVTRGRVAVRDFRRRKTVTVRAGKSYLARAPR
jgi:uncharacterized delta-60 repeat protein